MHDVERRDGWECGINIAGMIAKYFATSFAMLKVVSEPRVIQHLFSDLDDVEQLYWIAIEIDHVAGSRGLRSRVPGNTDIGLSERGRVIRAVAGHGHQSAFSLF